MSSTTLHNVRPLSQVSFATLTDHRYLKVILIHTSFLFVKLSFLFIHLLALYFFVSCVIVILFTSIYKRSSCNRFLCCMFYKYSSNLLFIFCTFSPALSIYINIYRCMYLYIDIYICQICQSFNSFCFGVLLRQAFPTSSLWIRCHIFLLVLLCIFIFKYFILLECIFK